MLKNLKKMLMPSVRMVWKSRPYAWVLLSLDNFAQRTVPDEPRDKKDFTVLLSPAGDGNIGDSAMLNSYLLNTSGPVKVFIKLPRRIDDSSVVRQLKASYGDRVEFYPSKWIYRAMPPFRFFVVRRFTQELNGASRFVVHGADTIDGGQASASLSAWSMCRIATARNIPSAVLGFSWRPAAPANVASAMVVASENTKLFARDGASYQRMRENGAQKIEQTADMAFSLRIESEPTGELATWVRTQEEASQKFCVLNVSGLIAKSINQKPEIARIVKSLHANGIAVLFLPHVIRKGDSDLPECRIAFDSFASSTDLIVEELLTPEEVRWIVGRAFVTVTGRMHLSILSISQLTPAIALSTAGKVEGLFDFFGMRDFVVNPDPGFGIEVARILETLQEQRHQVSGNIEKTLPSIVKLSSKNFQLERSNASS